MKKTIGIILMVVSALAFCLLIGGEIVLFKDGNLPSDIFGWIGNLFMPAVSVGVFFLGNMLRKK